MSIRSSRNRFQRCRPARMLEALESRQMLAASPIITEFVADNDGVLQDGYGDFSDWIEISNLGDAPLDLAGWHLTDDPTDLTKWTFPSRNLDVGEFLVVFASNNFPNVADPEGNLHASFKLSANGEYLALVDPGLSVVSEFGRGGTEFTRQVEDIAYGLPMQTLVGSSPIGESGLANATLLGHWKLDDPASLNPTAPGNVFAAWDQVVDSSGNNLHGVFQDRGPGGDGPVVGLPGASARTATAAQFEGIHQEAYLASPPQLKMASGFSILAWIKPDDVSDSGRTQRIFSQFPSGGVGYGFGIKGDELKFTTYSIKDYVTTSVDIPTDSWTHVSVVFASDNDATFYVNGQRAETILGDRPANIGNNNFFLASTGGGERYGGLLDDVRIYDGELSPEDIAALAGIDAPSTGDVRFHVPIGPEDDRTWKNPGFEDSNWDQGNVGIGFETTPAGYADVIESEVAAGTDSVYLRIPFTVDDPAALDVLMLRMKYDDGFVAYLNGTEVARANAPPVPAWDAAATAERPNSDAVVFAGFDISSRIAEGLIAGENVLAIHGLNFSDDDLLLLPDLYAVDTDYGPRYITTATPGAPNASTGFVGFVADTQFSVDRGFFESTDLDPGGVLENGVAITTATADATIVYTTDGSEPEVGDEGVIVNGIEYIGPIAINSTTTLRAAAFKTGFEPTNTDTHTYVFLDDVIAQSPGGEVPEGWPTGSVNGQVFDYGMDPAIVEHPEFGPQLRDALLDIPTLSVVTDLDNLNDPATGIYVNAQQDGRAWERPTSLELIHPDGSDGFQVDAGMRIRGGFSRGGFNPKHSFRFFFREEYGPKKLRFPLFGDEGVDVFDKIDLRTAQNYAWSNDTFNDETKNTFVREVFTRDLQREMGQPYTRSRYYHLYINGQYWGLYQTQERSEKDYGESYFGGVDDDYDVIKKNGVLDGNDDAWNELWALSNAGFATDEAYYAVQGKNPDGTDNPALDVHVDVDNLIDYMNVIFFTGSFDGPVTSFASNGSRNNFYALRNRNDREGWRFFSHDLEHSMIDVNEDRTGPFPAGNTLPQFNPQWLHQKLMDHPEYRLRFADAVHELYFNGGLMTPAGARALALSRASQIDLAIIAESARWGDQHNEPPLDKDTWEAAIDELVDDYFGARPRIVLDQLRNAQRRDEGRLVPAPLYPSVSAPEFSAHGGQVPAGFEVAMTAPPSVVTEELVLLTQGDDMLAFIPSDDSLETGDGPFWYEPGFVPNGWIAGTNGVGFEENSSTFANLIETDVSADWDARQTSVYGRIEFDLDADFDASKVTELTLRMKYDDGFVVYLNGQMVAADRAPSPSTWNSNATGARINILSKFFRNFDIVEHSSLLRPGKNVLAFQGLNRTDADADLLTLPELVLTRDVSLGSQLIYFTTNGEDPRLFGGDVNNAAARLFNEPLAIDETTQIQARTMISGQWSALATATFVVTPAGGGVAISEVNYNPYAPTADEQIAIPGVDNDAFEFIEFTNTNPSETVNLLGMHFTDGIDYTFGNVALEPGGHGVIVRDEAAFVERYGDGLNILGTYDGGLANGGERVELVDATENRIAEFEYADGGLWADRADGAGGTLELVDTDNMTAMLSGKHYAWRGSSEFGGTPGSAGAGPVGIVINEVLARTGAPVTATDSIELYNSTDADMDISGWWLSDSAGTLDKFVIPAGTVIGPGQYVVFDESHFNPTPAAPNPNDFALNGARGDDVWLVVPDETGAIETFVDDVHFGSSLNGVPFGVTASGSFLPQSGATLGCANTHTRIGSVIISEVNFNPGDPSQAALAIHPALVEDDLEFVEIYNSSRLPVVLTQWRLRGGVDMDFDDGQMLAAGEALVVISFDPGNPSNEDRLNAFRTHYNIDTSVAVVGGFGGQLSDSSEEVRLLSPDNPLAGEPNFIPHVHVDGVLYDDSSPWPASADGNGMSLQRQSLIFTGDLATSWSAAAPTPGVVTEPDSITGDFTGDGIVDAVDIDVLADAVTSGIVAFLDTDGSGAADMADVEFLVMDVLGTLAGDANLDGVVDGSDFNRWNDNKFQSCAKSWSNGDFNGDKVVDGADFSFWLSNSFSPVQATNAESGGTAPNDLRVPRQPFANVAVQRIRFIDAAHQTSAMPNDSIKWHRHSKLRMPAPDKLESRVIISDRIGADRGPSSRSDLYDRRCFAMHAHHTSDPAADVVQKILDVLLARWSI
jgi:hypothetical protein